MDATFNPDYFDVLFGVVFCSFGTYRTFLILARRRPARWMTGVKMSKAAEWIFALTAVSMGIWNIFKGLGCVRSSAFSVAALATALVVILVLSARDQRRQVHAQENA